MTLTEFARPRRFSVTCKGGPSMACPSVNEIPSAWAVALGSMTPGATAASAAPTRKSIEQPERRGCTGELYRRRDVTEGRRSSPAIRATPLLALPPEAAAHVRASASLKPSALRAWTCSVAGPVIVLKISLEELVMLSFATCTANTNATPRAMPGAREQLLGRTCSQPASVEVEQRRESHRCSPVRDLGQAGEGPLKRNSRRAG